MAIPKTVIDKDRDLSKSADELMELRWHWTLDPDNSKAVSFAEYARQVGRSISRIQRDARAWVAYQQSQKIAGPGNTIRPGAAQTPGDFRELARLSEDKQLAAEAIARTTGRKLTTVARDKREEVDAVVNLARERAARKAETGQPSTIEHEIEAAAETRAKAARLAEREREERKTRHTATFIKIEGKVGAMLARGREILTLSEGVPFTDDEREILRDSLGKLRALLKLLDLRIAGITEDTDWDAELARLDSK